MHALDPKIDIPFAEAFITATSTEARRFGVELKRARGSGGSDLFLDLVMEEKLRSVLEDTAGPGVKIT